MLSAWDVSEVNGYASSVFHFCLTFAADFEGRVYVRFVCFFCPCNAPDLCTVVLCFLGFVWWISFTSMFSMRVYSLVNKCTHALDNCRNCGKHYWIAKTRSLAMHRILWHQLGLFVHVSPQGNFGLTCCIIIHVLPARRYSTKFYSVSAYVPSIIWLIIRLRWLCLTVSL